MSTERKVHFAQPYELPDQCLVCCQPIAPRMLIGVDAKGYTTCADCLPADEKMAFYAAGWELLQQYRQQEPKPVPAVKLEFRVAVRAVRLARWLLIRAILAAEIGLRAMIRLVAMLRRLRHACR